MSTRPPQQFQATRDRQHRPHGKLVRRRHIGQAHAIIFRQGAGIESKGVDGQGQRHGAHGLKAISGHAVTRFLEDEPIAGVQQKPGTQVKSLLRAMHDEDLLRIARQASCPLQIALQGAAQTRLPFGLPVRKARLALDQFGTIGALPAQGRKVP
ncbi:hypothetical protein D3C87_1393010 [compost metagenome]